MGELVVVTTSYPEQAGDAQGHFVAAEVKRLTATADVTVLAPGRARRPLGAERVVGLATGSAFGFPGALERLRERPSRALDALHFGLAALAWLRRAPPRRIVAHFLLPCGVPIATRGLVRGGDLEIVVHGSDARLFARLPLRARLGRELVESGARLRFVSSELRELTLGSLPAPLRLALEAKSSVEPCAIEVEHAPGRSEARAALGIDARSSLAVIVARLVPGKRVDVALEACARIRDLNVVVIGDGPERARLGRRFPEARFVGQVSRTLTLEYVAAATVLVSASRLEGAPTVVREARALGTPVVCCSAGDLRAWAAADPGIHIVD